MTVTNWTAARLPDLTGKTFIVNCARVADRAPVPGWLIGRRRRPAGRRRYPVCRNFGWSSKTGPLSPLAVEA